ncbi:MAG: response regulator [Treponema sp.]|nr:response regulator [Treponema sp.]
MSSNKKILIIDDEKINIMALAHFLTPQYEILIAKNGELGLKAAEKHIPDLILLDIIMPEMDGYEVLKKLKESDVTKNIPVIFISGLANTGENNEKDNLQGAVDYISKPFDKDIVKDKINSFFNL